MHENPEYRRKMYESLDDRRKMHRFLEDVRVIALDSRREKTHVSLEERMKKTPNSKGRKEN
jgi:hypothetical protein